MVEFVIGVEIGHLTGRLGAEAKPVRSAGTVPSLVDDEGFDVIGLTVFPLTPQLGQTFEALGSGGSDRRQQSVSDSQKLCSVDIFIDRKMIVWCLLMLRHWLQPLSFRDTIRPRPHRLRRQPAG